jgi:hypothetical protein
VPYTNTYYLVNIEDSEGEGELQFPSSQEIVWDEEQLPSLRSEGGIPGVLTFPIAPVHNSRPPCMEPLCGNPNLVFFRSRPQNSTKTGRLKFGNK